MKNRAIRSKLKSRSGGVLASAASTVLLSSFSMLMFVSALLGIPSVFMGEQASSSAATGVASTATLVSATTKGASGESSKRTSLANGDAASSSEGAEAPTTAKAPSQDVSSEAAQNSDGQPTEAPVAAQKDATQPTTLEKKLKSVDGHTYTVRVTYGPEANVPEGAELQVVELNQIPADWDDEQKRANEYKDRPYATESLLSADDMAKNTAELSRILEVGEDGRILWNKTFDVSLVADGQAVTPNAEVQVEVETDAVSAAESDALEAALLKADGSRRLAVANATGTKEDEAEKPAAELTSRVAFATAELGRIGLAEVAQRKFGWAMYGDEISVYGARTVKTDPYEVPLDLEYVDGLRLIEVFGVAADPTHPFGTTLWVESKSAQDAQPSFDGVLGYRLVDGSAERVFGLEGTNGLVSFSAGDLMALVWESGMRHTVLDAGDVTLVGEMPVGTSADAQDVTGEYADARALVPSDEDEQTRTVAAYNVSLSVDGTEWNPGADPVRVKLSDDAIDTTSGEKLYDVVRVGEGGATPVTAKVEDGAALFDMGEAGSYAVVERVVVEREYTASDGKTYKITVGYDTASGFPKNAALVVNEVKAGDEGYDAYLKGAASELGADVEDVTYVKELGISVVNPETGQEFQPTKDVDVSIELLDRQPAEGTRLGVVHFGDDGKAEAVEAKAEGNTVEFSASGFSVYVIAKTTEKSMTVVELDELNNATTGFYLSYGNTKQKYCTNKLNNKNAFIEIEITEINQASKWYFEFVEQDSSYYIYTIIDGANKYMKNSSENLMSLADSRASATKFELEKVVNSNPAKFTIKVKGENKWLQHSGSGNGIRLYTNTSNTENSQFTITYADKPNDYYELDGKTYCIAYDNGDGTGIGLTSNATAQLVQINSDTNHLQADTGTVARWTFNSIGGADYTISTKVDGQTKYFVLDSGGLSLSDNPCTFTLNTNDGGKFSFQANSQYLSVSPNAFDISAETGDNTWFILSDLEALPVIDWDSYVYVMKRNSTVTLDDIFSDCQIPTITGDYVESVVASDSEILQVNGLSITNLKTFTEPQTLTLGLIDGSTGTIKVTLEPLAESDILNTFLDDGTTFSYEGETDTHSLTEGAILKQPGDALSLNLSFSEVPEGQEGERQMTLLAPMTYNVPVGLTVDEESIPESITINVQSGESTYYFNATVTLGTNAETGAQTLTVKGSYGDQQEVVRNSTKADFTISVTVQVNEVPKDYALGNDLTLKAVLPRNVKVDSLTAGNYDEAAGTITYTVVVEAESDIDSETTAYPVTISDSSTGDSPTLQFVSGSYTYAHSDGFALPEGKLVTQVNAVNVESGATADFTQLPLTVEHMYGGDTITLTYTAKVLKGAYDKESQQTKAQNTVTITNNDAGGTPNPSNIPDDDTASVTTTVPYTPLVRKYETLDGSWAYWRVTVNPDGYTLNGGENYILADTFDDDNPLDADQSIDYASIVVDTGQNANTVTYDYSGNTGTFVIPDNTPVTITYRTRISAQPGEAKTFRGTAVLKDQLDNGSEIATSTAGVIDEAVAIYPSASDVGGSGDNYMVKLYIYGDGQMQQGIEGATFILLDANHRPLEYKVGANKGQPVTFTTGSDGYANIALHEEEGDVSIEKNTGYYLEMMQAVPGYQKDNTLYSFMITDDPSYNSGGFYKYHNGDTMKVRLYAPSPGLSVSMRFSGSYSLTEQQQNNVTTILQKWVDNGDGVEDDNGWVEVERHAYSDTKWGSIKFEADLYDESLGAEQNFYRVVEENQSPWDLPESIYLKTTYYCMVNTASSNPELEPQEFTVTSANDSVNVVIDNCYEDPQLTIVKMDKSTGELLPGAEFTVYKIVNGEVSGDAVTTRTTSSEEESKGELVIRGGDDFESETLYGIKETKAPDDYWLPLVDEWHYFYFCNDEYLEPSILANLPEDATAINLTNDGDTITVGNQKKSITVPVMKTWQGGVWPADAEVVVGLYKSVAGGDAEQVLNEDEGHMPRTVTLTSAMPYNNTAFTNLPSRDDQGRNITYSIKEETINGKNPLAAGYNQEYGVSSAGVYIVRNKPATTLTVNKEWYDLGGNRVQGETLATQPSVFFDVYRSSTQITDPTPDDDGITNADMTNLASGMTKVRESLTFGDPDWTMSIDDLDKQDDTGKSYYYYILETVPSFGNELYVLGNDGFITIQNKIAPDTVNLTVTKAALVGDPRAESLNSDFEFTLKLKMDDTHPIRKWQVYTDAADSNNNLVTDMNGEVTFKLKPTNPNNQPTAGASITLNLPAGVIATVTEAYNPEYTVDTSATIGDGSKADNNRTFSYATRTETSNATLTYTNTLHVVCKVVKDEGREDPRQVPFESLKSALKYIHDNPGDFTSPWTIYMLEDYTMPATDGINLAEGESLTLTTASTTDSLFPFKGGEETDRAVITRGGAGESILKNAGTLTLENICLDGGNTSEDAITATGDGGLVNSTGTLNLEDKTTLRNSTVSGKGGAVYAEGTVNVADGVKMTGNSAPSASVLYLKGTLNMTGGEISKNTGASNGAVVVEDAADVINLSGNPFVFENTNTQGKAANMYIGVDSDSTVNVVEPGLGAAARIGITAREGHMLIGEQFATAEFGQTSNLGCFVNDVYGYRGKLKDGTSTNVVWNGLKLAIKKEVDPVGANANDRFTITLSSTSIIMSTYVIDGTLDYTVTAARQGRPGRIVFNNVKAGDSFEISPLPVGEYTITEASSNYAPSYTISETGSNETPTAIEGGTFTAENDSTVTVTNTRRLAPVNLTKALDDRLAGDSAVPFNFTVLLQEEDGTPVKEFELASGIATDINGVATFTMSPTDAVDAIQYFLAPVGATMTITEAENSNYRIATTANTIPSDGESEGEAVDDLNKDNDNVFAFQVTDAGADVTFSNVRKMAEIELSKTLVGKVSKTESYTFTLTLKNQDDSAVSGYAVYRDESGNITTNENGVATITFTFGENETEPKSITLTIPDGTRLTIEETDINGHADYYDTTYSKNGGTTVRGTSATIDNVSETDTSIAFTNIRRPRTITVENQVEGYAGNVVPFTYTVMVTDGGENDYDIYSFTDGVQKFDLTPGANKDLTVPDGASVTIIETMIIQDEETEAEKEINVIGYETTVKHGANSAKKTDRDEFDVTEDVKVVFTNTQLINLVLVNNTSSKFENVEVFVDNAAVMYRVNDTKDGQTELSTNTPDTFNSSTHKAMVSVDSGKTAILEVKYENGKSYKITGDTPEFGYYYNIVNESAYHEDAKPARLHKYNVEHFQLEGKLKYGVEDSTITFSSQPMVSFDVNGGEWMTDMEGYNVYWDDEKEVFLYQKAVPAGGTVAVPIPDPVYPTAEGIEFLGWTANETFAKSGHSAGEDISSNAYNFDMNVNEPVTLYAVWSKPIRETRVITVRNGHNEDLRVIAVLTQNDIPKANYSISEDLATGNDGQVGFNISSGEYKNLMLPNGTKLVLTLEDESLAESSEFVLMVSDDNKAFTINSVERDGTVTFIPGICKITDSVGNVLYKSDGKPAVYATLSDAFTDYEGILYTDVSLSTKAAQAAVKMLVDEYEISSKHTFPQKDMVLTTAGKNDETFPFMGTQERTTLYRKSFTTDSLFLINKTAKITLTNIILDGGSVAVSDSVNGGLIKISNDGAELTVNARTTMRNTLFANYTAGNTRGGAIYMDKGSLNVQAGLFSNLHAGRGGAICVAGGTFSVKGMRGSTKFENCFAEKRSDGNGDDGGAIYYGAADALVIDGGMDKDDPGIIFNSCVALSEANNTTTAGDGGAIFADTRNSVQVNGCTFTECSAKDRYDKNKERGYGGGAICAINVSKLEVNNCSFTDCDTLLSGGAVSAQITTSYNTDVTSRQVEILNCSFNRCNAAAQGGAIGVYQSDPNKNTATTRIFVYNSTFSDCSTGATVGSGGAIQSYLPCMELEEATFSDCWCGREGGGINQYFGAKFVTNDWTKSSFKLTGCRFYRCRAEDRSTQDPLVHYGGAANSKAHTIEVSESYFEDCVSTLKEGGALHCGAMHNSSTAKVELSTFINCSAKVSGGGVFASNAKLEVIDSNFYGCSSLTEDGGAICHKKNNRGDSTQNTTIITGCTFCANPVDSNGLSCSAAKNGGAIWTRAGSVTIEDCTINGCTATNGGGIYLSKEKVSQTATISGSIEDGKVAGAITNCQAVSGSAVYVEDTATFTGSLEVSGNAVSGANSGAIQTVDAGKLYFEGDVVVENNTSSVESNDHDVLMQIDGNTIINTTSAGLGSGAHIGVYVSDPNNAYDKHGKEGQPFGTYNNSSDAGSNYLDGFFNDRDSELFGCQLAENDSKIYWGIFVCKITDGDGNLLQRFNGRDAVYQRLSTALDEFTGDHGVTGGNPVYIKMLVENYAIKQEEAISNFPAADITLTTASTSDSTRPYRGKEGTVCTISRENSESPLFSLNTPDATFQLKDITLDGRKDKTTTEGDYNLITAANGAIIVNSGTTLQYGSSVSGAAITGVQVTINGTYDADKKEPTVKIANCTATVSGGAILAQNLTITNDSKTQGEYGTAFIDCTSGTGGGGAIIATGTAVSMTGASFTDCYSTGDGGVLFHNHSNTEATTTIQNCAFINGHSDGAGGAVSSAATTLEVGSSSFDTCSAQLDGGAINHTGATATTITETTFSGCTTTAGNANGLGGSVYTAAKTIRLTGGSFKNSTATNNGGALYCQNSDDGSAATISGTSFENCSTTLENGYGGAIYSLNKALALQDYTPEGSTKAASTTISACTAPGYSGAVHMATWGSTLNITDNTKISGCYAKIGGAIYLPAGVTLNLTDSPEFSQNGYTIQSGGIIDADEGACIYLAEGSRINLSGSPKFSRNILPNKNRITNGGIYDNVRQDIYLAGYASDTELATNADSIYVVGELTGSTIWVWPEQRPHRLANEQFAKIATNVTVSAESLSKLRNALPDGDGELGTHCNNGEYLAGVQISAENKNVYWDKMYTVRFKKKDNKGDAVPGAGFTLYKNLACTESVATVTSADGENDTDAQGKLLAKGTVEFASIRIGAYYMKETAVPSSYKENDTTYLVLVGTPYMSRNQDNAYLWVGDGPLNVPDAESQIARHKDNTSDYYLIFPLDDNNKAILTSNLASSSAGIENIRNDYQVSFMKVDSSGAALPGAEFTIYTAILDDNGEPRTFDDGYPQLMRWSRDGETYPAPVVSADDTDAYKDKDNKKLAKGMVYIRELPLGTYYLLETGYPERNGENRRTYYAETDRVFKLDLEEVSQSTSEVKVTLSEWRQGTESSPASYVELSKNSKGIYQVFNQEVVCKLTDAYDNLLYVQGHEVWENKTESSVRFFPAIYPTLEEGFEAAQTGSFVYANGNAASVGSGLKLKVLKDFTLSSPVTYSSPLPITFTTAETRAAKDRYIFSTTRTSDTARAYISRAYSETSADANAGALITINDGANMTLQNIQLIGQKSKYNGRAIHVTSGTLSILNNTRIEKFTQKAEANSAGESDIKGGAILMDDGTSLIIDGGYNRTAIFSANAVVNNRVEGHAGSDGGAIAVGMNCTLSVTNAQFASNIATAAVQKKGNGGAVSIDKTKNADEMMNLPVYNVVFSKNEASYQGGALRVAENCTLVVNNCKFTNNKANTFGSTETPGEGGAIAVLSAQDAPSALTITGGSFTGNSAIGSKGGAVKIGGYGTLILNGSLTMSKNTAANGGAVTVAPGANVTMEQGTISGNIATDNGGAFYVEGKQVGETIIRGAVTVNGGKITSKNTASLGSAVYVNDNASLTVTNASITGNTASGSNGGAINVGGANARLYFGGAPTVFDNFGIQGQSQQMNLVLSEDDNGVINTTADGLTNGIIGVYVVVPDPGSSTETIFTNHGLPGKPFGTFGDTGRIDPQVFRSDHSLSLYGVKNESDANDESIYWVDVICKLTDANDKILYQDISLTINGKKQTRKAQAVYARITDYGDSTAVSNGFNALRDGFAAARGTLYIKNGDTYSKCSSDALTTVKVKMLKDVDLDKSIQYTGSRGVVFTTAETEDSLDGLEIQTMRNGGDYFLFRTERMEAEGTASAALIQRGFSGKSMIIANKGSNLTLTGITLDGVKSQYTASSDGGIVSVTASGLTVADGATLQNSATTGNGGAVRLASGVTMTMSGGTITGCSANNGGAVYVDNNVDNKKTVNLTGGTITGCSAKNGGAVYVNEGATVNLTGGTINGNAASVGGAGVYLVEGSTLNLSGNPYFGGTGIANGTLTTSTENGLAGKEPTGNFVSMSSTALNPEGQSGDPKNGGKAYPSDANGNLLVRQDIYLQGHAAAQDQALASIVLTANLDAQASAGSIWVWANDEDSANTDLNHYQMLHQFAVLSDSFSGSVSEGTYKAFRNARPDAFTDCGGDYLTGQAGANPMYVYWTGGFDFSFTKTNGFGAPLSGAKFRLYSDYSFESEGKIQTLTEVRKKNGEVLEATSSPDGTVGFEKVSPGIYYMLESSVPDGYVKTMESQTNVLTKETSSSDAASAVGVNPVVYVVLLGDAALTIPTTATGTPWAGVLQNISQGDVAAQIGTGSNVRNYAIFSIDPVTGLATNNPDIAAFGIMNQSDEAHKVILKKTAKDTYESLEGARFRIFRADLSEVINEDYDKTNYGYTSSTSGVYFIDQLPDGKYYLVETVVPTGAASSNGGKVFILEVKDGMAREVETNQTIAVPEDASELATNLRTWVAGQS